VELLSAALTAIEEERVANYWALMSQIVVTLLFAYTIQVIFTLRRMYAIPTWLRLANGLFNLVGLIGSVLVIRISLAMQKSPTDQPNLELFAETLVTILAIFIAANPLVWTLTVMKTSITSTVPLFDPRWLIEYLASLFKERRRQRSIPTARLLKQLDEMIQFEDEWNGVDEAQRAAEQYLSETPLGEQHRDIAEYHLKAREWKEKVAKRKRAVDKMQTDIGLTPSEAKRTFMNKEQELEAAHKKIRTKIRETRLAKARLASTKATIEIIQLVNTMSDAPSPPTVPETPESPPSKDA